MSKKLSGWEKMRQERLEATKDIRIKKAISQKETRAIRKKYGLCTRCGKNDAIPNRALCKACKIDVFQNRVAGKWEK